MANEERNNFTAANSMPLKVIRNKELLDSIQKNNRIIPIHMQVCPTNFCNLNCPFCSCNSVERTQKLGLDELKELVDIAVDIGTKSFTVTGGGEPLMHREINEFLQYSKSEGIELGLVSNGLLLNRLTPESLETLTWARISFGDFREFDSNFLEKMDYAVANGPSVDWAFSYVVGKDYNPEKIKEIINYANQNNFTHVRLVPDLYDVENIDMGELEELLAKDSTVDLEKVIFQDRQEYKAGEKNCKISLLKPLIAPDGNIYPCCGVQYALTDTSQQRMFPKSMSMGHYKDLKEIIEQQKEFDGSKCGKCYYENYNKMLNAMTKSMKHEQFL